MTSHDILSVGFEEEGLPLLGLLLEGTDVGLLLGLDEEGALLEGTEVGSLDGLGVG